jgi:molybdopterin synthase catalytic subunit
VTRLEYQAYTPLAMKTLSSIIEQAHISWTQPTDLTPLAPTSEALLRVVVIHRLGVVPVGQTSIIIAVSSPHRREAFEACEWILEQVKLKVQIWKREWYAGSEDAILARDGGNPGPGMEPSWKANFPPRGP